MLSCVALGEEWITQKDCADRVMLERRHLVMEGFV